MPVEEAEQTIVYSCYGVFKIEILIYVPTLRGYLVRRTVAVRKPEASLDNSEHAWRSVGFLVDLLGPSTSSAPSDVLVPKVLVR